MKPNVFIAQSGGPSAVINNSLRGVIDFCHEHPEVFGRVYGGWHGIEGALKEELLDLSAQDPREVRLLETTPAAGAIGTCRYKLKAKQQEDFQRVIDVFKAHHIGFFFYIGGNDSMDTAHKISKLAAEKGLSLVATGVPKTIDNDVGDAAFKLVDHTPGFGSTARYWACNILSANEENAGSSPADPVLVLQAMGRKIGFIPASVRLADPKREMPLQIYLTEAGLNLEQLADNVSDQVRRTGRCLVVISEGLDVGDIGAQKDSFGHTAFGASDLTAQQAVVSYLNRKGLPATGKARGQVPGTDQRHSIVLASSVDLLEAYESGRKAAQIAMRDGNGFMATILREPGPVYKVRYDKVPLELMANSERFFPKEWIAANRVDVTDEFIAYAKPLIGEEWVRVPLENGLPRFAKLKPLFAEKKCPPYLPEAYRKK